MEQANQLSYDQPVYVQFFGHFRVTVDGHVINESSSRTRRPWSLLQYLIVSRQKTISRQQLMEALWPDGGSDQPEKALKNLVYRVRTYFAEMGVPFAQDVILYKNSNYYLNNNIPWIIDFEQFEEYFRHASEANLPAGERIANYKKAIDLYQGDFLAEHTYEDWILPFNAYYHSLFLKCVEKVLPLLEKENLYEDIEDVCSRALTVDKYAEPMHLAYMQALIAQNKKNAAASYYDSIADMFFRELGVIPGEELQQLYSEISQVADYVQTDLHLIKEKMNEREYSNDAFYCDFEIFRNLYRLEARTAERAGQSVFIGLFTLTDKVGSPPEAEMLNKSMALLLEAIHSGLRRGDVVSRYSLSQYILMLPTITVENGEMVLRRVSKKFERTVPFDSIRLDARIQPLDPFSD